MAGIEALGTAVGGICRYRGPLRTLLSGPREECRHEPLSDAVAAMGWIDVNALQVCHPDRMDTARTAEASDEVTHRFVAVTCE
jgi:hypothetical protein